MRALAWFLLLAWPCASLPAPEQQAILNWFSVDNGQWIVPPEELANSVPPGFDMELDQQHNEGKVFVLRMDLDHDGVPEYLVQNTSTCGNGGCPYAIYAGRGRRLLGEMFGATFWVLLERLNNMQVLQSLSYLGGGQAVVTRYVFDGVQYKDVSARDVFGEQIDEVLNTIHRAPRFQLNQATQRPLAGNAPKASRP